MTHQHFASPFVRGVWALPLALSLTLAACGTPATSGDETTATEAVIEEVADTTEETTAADASAEASNTKGTLENTAGQDVAQSKLPTRDGITINETVSDDASESHAITADGTSASYQNIEVTKTGDADGDEADFYGTNAAVFATNGATLDLSNVIVTSAGTHANAVFSYGEGTTVNIADSVIETTGNCSGGIMVTGGGTLNATNLNIHTTGNSSAAIRSDRGGGTQIVTGGSYVTDGTGSPVIYSTADVNVSDATLTSTASQGVVVEGKNSVTLNNVDLTASNTTKNSDKSDWYQAVMIYQSMSGDAAQGEASFTMNGGTLTNKNGDVFFVNNTVVTISLADAEIVNEDAEGVFLRAAAAGWGSEGSNGGHVTLNASDQDFDGAMVVDEVSSLNLYLKDASSFEGTINADGAAGDVYVEIEDGSTWTLTDDAYITALTCGADAIELNGHTLYVDGVAYEAGTASTGEAIEVEVSSGGGMGKAPGEGGGPGMGEPPAKPGEDGSTPSGEPPARPGENEGAAEDAGN